MLRLSSVCLAALLCACAVTTPSGAGVVVSPGNNIADPQWSPNELAQPAALRNLRRTPEASFHLLRVVEEPNAHVADKSDLVFTVVAGDLELWLGGQKLNVKRGDVVEIPRGTPVRSKSLTKEPGVAYLIYTPALAAGDRRAVAAEQARDSSWKWNLWAQ